MALPQPTQVRIYNRALALLGSVNRSTNIDDGLGTTDTLNEHWAMAVRDLTAEHPWNFAIHRATLNRHEQVAEDAGWLYKIPTDCLRWLPPSRDSEHWFCGAQEGNYILAAAGETIRIRYIRLVEDVSAWPPHFVTCMGYRLAYDAAQAITQSASVAEEMRVKYEGRDGEGGALAKAKRADGLASGDRERGSVVARSRALSAAMGGRR
jgi:hypothetical protein